MKRVFSWIALLVLAVVFVAAGAFKAGNPAAFAEEIRNFRLLPWPADAALALYLPGLEIIAGLALCWPRFRKGALLLVLALLVAFLVALISAWARGLNLDCGCFGENGPKRSVPWALLEDLGLLALAGWLAWQNLATESTEVAEKSEKAQLPSAPPR